MMMTVDTMVTCQLKRWYPCTIAKSPRPPPPTSPAMADMSTMPISTKV
ncbi:Uncharacterised protein [Mycobacteroides abscessus subsp. abscessus]|nr:Uncharacterised protein [Mycobacteroides abscessus subsp. abscessus]